MGGAAGQECALGTKAWWPGGHVWTVKADTHPDASLPVRKQQAPAAVLALDPAGSLSHWLPWGSLSSAAGGPPHISILISQPS